MADLNGVSGQVVDAAIAVHRALGPGLLERVYAACLAEELRGRGLYVEAQVPVPVVYKGVKLDVAYRLDLRVQHCVIVEVKAIEKFAPVHKAQLLSYLRLTNCRLGLLLNFNTQRLVDGIERVVNKLEE